MTRERAPSDHMACGIVRGRRGWTELATEVDALHRRVDTPITARRRWLDTWLDCYSDFSPAVVTVFRGDTLVGLAPLASVTRLGVTHYVPMGHGPSDLVELSATDDDVAESLSDGVATMLRESGTPWSLTAKNVVTGSPVLAHLAQNLSTAALCRGDVLPQMHFGEVRELRQFVSRNHHQQINRLRNRANRDGLVLEVDHLRGPQVLAALDELIGIRAKRDLDAGRRLKTQDAQDGAFLRQVISVHAEADLVEVTVLRLEGAIAAFTLNLLDGPARRLWTLAFDPIYRENGLGRLCMDETIIRALSQPECTEYDFMRGDESYKRTFSNHVVDCEDLFAWSSFPVRVVFDSGRTVRVALKERAATDSRAEWILETATKIRRSWWHRGVVDSS